METREQINALESRQLELQAIMSKSDAHVSKCAKLGLKFKSQYPEDYDEYLAAQEEYSANEVTLADLYAHVDSEEPAPLEGLPY